MGAYTGPTTFLNPSETNDTKVILLHHFSPLHLFVHNLQFL